MKGLGERLSKRLDLTRDDSGTIKGLAKDCQTPDKRSAKDSPIHRSIDQGEHESDDKDLGE